MPFKNSISIRTPLFFLDDDQSGSGTLPKEPSAEEKKAAEEKARQDALDKQFADRAERGKETGRKELLAELGVSDPEEAKKLLMAAKEAEEEKKTEKERLQALVDDATKKAEQAEASAKKLMDQAMRRVQDSEIKIAASAPVLDKDGKTVLRPEFLPEAIPDVLAALNREGIEEEENGSFKGIEKALADLAKAKPHWLAKKNEKAPANGSPNGPTGKKPQPTTPATGPRTPVGGSL